MNFKRKPLSAQPPYYKPMGFAVAKNILQNEMKKGKAAKIAVYYDPDIDGLYAGILAQWFLKACGCPSISILNSNRAHGFKLADDKLEKLRGYTILAVDFSVGLEDVKRILSYGINLVNIDHHEISLDAFYGNKTYPKTNTVVFRNSQNNCYATILNNQYELEEEKFRFLSGAGMVFYFLYHYALEMGMDLDKVIWSDCISIVGLTLLSDIRVIEQEEAHFFLLELFKSDTDYVKYLVWLATNPGYSARIFSPFGVPNMNRDFVDFNFSPLINSVLRANRGDLAMLVLKGEDIDKIEKLKNTGELFEYRDIQKYIIANIAEYVKKGPSDTDTITKEYSNMSVCGLVDGQIETKGQNISNYIGVACSRMKDAKQTGVVLLVDKNTGMLKRGSLRGGFDGVDYLKIFLEFGVPCAGHKNAFGILPHNVNNIDFNAINNKIKEEEERYNLEYGFSKNNKIIEIGNLNMFLKSPNSNKIAMYNSLSRDSHRMLLKYTGDFRAIEIERKTEKFVLYLVDGIKVNCFNTDLEVKDGLISIGFNNKNYVGCTLRPSL